MKKTQTKPKTKARRPVNEVIFEPVPLFDDEKVIQRRLALVLFVILMGFIGTSIIAWHFIPSPFGEWIAAIVIAIPVGGLIFFLSVRGGEN